MIKEINDATFKEEVLDVPGYVLVDFYRPTCSVCPMLEAVLLELQAEPVYAQLIKFVKLDTDQGHDNAITYGVNGHPTSVLFKDGLVVSIHPGASIKSYYMTWLTQAIYGAPTASLG